MQGSGTSHHHRLGLLGVLYEVKWYRGIRVLDVHARYLLRMG